MVVGLQVLKEPLVGLPYEILFYDVKRKPSGPFLSNMVSLRAENSQTFETLFI